MHTVIKRYDNFPAAHRQHRHDGHCGRIHGHDYAFEFEFTARALDDCGFVVDFGKLQKLKQLLTERFDHTLLICADDPKLFIFEDLNLQGLCDLRVVKGTSCEQIAEDLLNEINDGVVDDDGVWCSAVTVFEGSMNSATYRR